MQLINIAGKYDGRCKSRHRTTMKFQTTDFIFVSRHYQPTHASEIDHSPVCMCCFQQLLPINAFWGCCYNSWWKKYCIFQTELELTRGADMVFVIHKWVNDSESDGGISYGVWISPGSVEDVLYCRSNVRRRRRRRRRGHFRSKDVKKVRQLFQTAARKLVSLSSHTEINGL